MVCLDINSSMLRVGMDRAQEMGYDKDRITWTEGDAQKLPFEDASFDAYTIAFGIRNVVQIEQVPRLIDSQGRFARCSN